MRFDGEAGEDGGFVLELDGDFGGGEEVEAEFDDFGELACFDAVVVVVGDPDLQDAGFILVTFAAAIEEGLGSVRDFGDVEVRRGGGAVRQSEGEAVLRVFFEDGEEVLEVHLTAGVTGCEEVDTVEEVVKAVTGHGVIDLKAGFGGGDPAGLTHDGEMFRDGGEIAADDFLNFGDAKGLAGEEFGDLQARGVGEGLDDGDAILAGDGGHYLAKVPNS